MDENKISMLAKYGEELTIKKYITNPAIAREKEIKDLILILLTPDKSAILTGKPGIGKTAIVEGLSFRIASGDIPEALKGFKVIKINTSALRGETNVAGEVVNKVQLLVEELKQLDNVILFVDEIHTLIGNVGGESLDFANMLKPGLDRGSIKMIGATTTEEYEKFILRDKAFNRRFEKIEVLEPDRETTIEIMMGTFPRIEHDTNCKLAYEDYIQRRIMGFLVDYTNEYKRLFEIGSRYPDISLALLAKAFSYAVYNNETLVTLKHIHQAIINCKTVYPDVIKKDLPVFFETFKRVIDDNNIKFIDNENNIEFI